MSNKQLLLSIYNTFCKSEGISTDTREDLKNKIFFALVGENFDGNNYIELALNKGAKMVVCNRDTKLKSDKIIIVENTLDTLQQLANLHKKKLKIPVIGITGSNGKTSTKELIGLLLNSSIKTFYTKGNLNNHIGVPLSLLSIEKSDELAVIEMGANHPGEIAELCEICDPDYAIVTNVGKAHLEGFLTYDNILETKTALYRYVINKNGKIFINNNLIYFDYLIQDKYNIITYSSNKTADYYIKEVSYSPFSIFQYKNNKTNISSDIINSNLIGTYNTINMIAAIAIAKEFDIEDKEIKKVIENYKPNNNRSQIIDRKNNLKIILDAYNANPTSVKEALNTIFNLKGKRLVILGDMLELGKVSRKEHQHIVNELIEHSDIAVVLVGNEFNNCEIPSYFKKYKNVEEYIKTISTQDFNSKTVLIKGSRGIQLEKIIDYI